ncbi:CBO0543 family protein [Paenisporosarcina sp. TG20]|uniref:CBO0543 family protein n=1 Tax=Paenisporosarcina sp. TG20 TaxID=1211706 RepID=UPI00350FA43A
MIRLDWKKYGLLYLLSAGAGNILCLLFVSFNFYSFPYVLFPQILQMPFHAVATFFLLYVLIGVRYSPVKMDVENSILLGFSAYRYAG